MNETELHQRLTQGEDSRHQFKRDATNADSLAAELAAFANSGGGTLFIGVNDDGSVAGLDTADIRRLNQLLSNASSPHVRPPVHPLTENVRTTGGIIMIVTVPDGLSKPYLDAQGRLWVKQGADKRHVTSREEMQRMFQRSGLVRADRVPMADSSSADLDQKAFSRYFERRYGHPVDASGSTLDQVLQNMGLGDGRELNLSALMLFGLHPLRWYPAFTIKAVAFPGQVIWDDRYLDSEDINGTLIEQYQRAMAFLKRNLHHVQRGRGFNTPGLLEIPEVVLQELLVNALVHRDYFTSASIRLLVFADRVEIISPGHLPDSLSLDDVRHGKTNRRNPTLTEHAFQLLPYRGLGSGIPRALQEWPRLELINDEAGNQFTARVWRPQAEWTAETDQARLADPLPVSDDASHHGTEHQAGGSDTARVTDQVTGEVTREVTGEVGRLLAVIQGEMKRSELQQALALKHEDHFRDAYLTPALSLGLIEMTIPDKPRSRLQRYRLTARGQHWLQFRQKPTATS